ncbi:hypothetical protein AB0F77_41935 [Streptomyces sp. NPDC026672]|uniref:hypothetical protein n=1 Tax=unclassified Streptomyces TaxID=2593676 RepID=UPI0033F5E68F
MDRADFPHDLLRLQVDWYRTYDALAASRSAHVTVLRRRLNVLSARLRWHPYWSRTAGAPAARAELRRQARALERGE